MVAILKTVGAALDGDVTKGLLALGHQIVAVPLEELSKRITQETELVLLDMGCDETQAIEVCRRVREKTRAPIIAVTGETSDMFVVLALRAGADDCVNGDCSVHELAARIEAVTRRGLLKTVANECRALALGGVHVDPTTRSVHVNGSKVALTNKEFELIRRLVCNSPRIVSREDLIECVWGDTWAPRSRTLDTHINNLRVKLGPTVCIKTVRGIGFRLETEVVGSPNDEESPPPPAE
ncbi:response regulator transcription factor [Brevibacterium sp. XM4083]|uniref:response regulator transcription factor n=1 Tax=Brevibacterium sp. XM4083 TaxID=2583238 RepID=UPI00202EE097|nr:response regulator transcription factor [Brevibacterium sp. XM4083]MCM1011809.1 response regulator transcription factor [Brevibacterium sp. XM4083]